MFKSRLKKFGVAIACIIMVFALVGCGNGSGEGETGDSEGSIGQQLGYKITGIDAGAGVVQSAERAVEDYDLDFSVQTSSGAAMTQALGDAIAAEKPIVVTAWTPHWKFAKYDIKYLEDPKGSFGGEEKIHTVARLGLKDDMPSAYKIADQFNWTTEDMEAVMLQISEGVDVKEAAAQWIENNQDKVDEWLEGAEKVDGEKIKLAYVAWDSEISSTNVLGLVLEGMGYDVTLIQVEAGPMWAAIASGDADLTTAVWLPVTHEKYLSDYKDQIDDLGPNLEGARIGLAVPSYMDINSIEDLAK